MTSTEPVARPATDPPTDVWSDVVGQPDVVATLRAAAEAAAEIVAGRTVQPGVMTHAWLFTGPPGSGRSVAARAFAAALQCPYTGCGVCPDCHTVKVGTHADVRVVEPEGLSIAVREMRELVRLAAYHPSGERWQIVIIADADRLTEGAANALLKAIEEPSPRTVFLLCAPSTHPDDVPLTIRSRCRVVALRTPSAADVADVLRRDNIDPDRAAWAAAAAQGHVGRARRLARDPEAAARRDAVLDIPLSLTSIPACFTAADELVRSTERESATLSSELDTPEREALATALGAGGTGKGAAAAARGSAAALKDLERRQRSRATRAQRDALDRALIDLAAYYRDVVVSAQGAEVTLAHADRADQIRRLAGLVGADGGLSRLEAVLACREAIELNVKPRIAVEAMAVALRLPPRQS